MIISGKYTSAEIFTEHIEEAALNWVRAQCDHRAFEGIRIVQMPDVHAGSSCNVGTAYRVGTYLNPEHIGVDIGCSISMHRLSVAIPAESLALLDHRIREQIPTGLEIYPKNSLNEKELFHFLNRCYQRARSVAPELIQEVSRIDARFVSSFCQRIKLQEGVFYKSLGTLGGGNHFIEYGEEPDGTPWLTIHCGSRNLGAKVSNHWRSIASNPKRGDMIGFLWGDTLNAYLSDMVLAQAYAAYNHEVIRSRIFNIFAKLCKAKCVESIHTPHNYIDISDEGAVLRKGSVDASKGAKVCIPFNMRDGIAIGIGKGNDEWLCSAPHGAGRALSRHQAKKQIALSDFVEVMQGIVSTSVTASTLDEAPQAYKPMEEILSLIEPTVDITSIVKPKLNIKDLGV